LRRPHCARSVARLARVQARNRQLLHRATNRVPKINLNLIFQVAARLVLGFLFRATPASEKLAKQIPEARSFRAAANTAGTRARRKIKSAKIEIDSRSAGIFARWWCAALEVLAVKSVLVVHLPLFRIRQYVVRFLKLLELFFRGLVPRIQVRM